MMTGAASAQQRTLYDKRGNVIGRSATDSSGRSRTTMRGQGDQPRIHQRQHDDDLRCERAQCRTVHHEPLGAIKSAGPDAPRETSASLRCNCSTISAFDLSRLHPPSSSRRLRDHRLAATSEGEALRTEGANHNRLDKRIGNLPVSRPLDDEVRPGSSARILSGNEGLHCTKGTDRDGLWQVAVNEIARRVEVVSAQEVQRPLLGGVVDTQCGGKVDLAFAAPNLRKNRRQRIRCAGSPPYLSGSTNEPVNEAG